MASTYEGRNCGLSRKGSCDLADARQIAALPLPHIASGEAYLAVFHAAQAYIFEPTGKVAKTHRGVRSEFTVSAEPSRASAEI